MLRNSLLGAIVTGVSAAFAGYVWVAFEFPFAIALPAVAGLFALMATSYPLGRALIASLAGGIAFTVAFVLAVFVSLTDGLSASLPAWLGAILAAGAAGAIVGAMLDRPRRAHVLAFAASSGMLAAVIVAALLRMLAPASVDIAGPTQTAYFTSVIAVVGSIVGAGLGVGFELLGKEGAEETLPAGGMHPSI